MTNDIHQPAIPEESLPVCKTCRGTAKDEAGVLCPDCDGDIHYPLSGETADPEASR